MKRSVLALRGPVLPLIPIAFGTALALLLFRERRARETAERLGGAVLETLLNAIDANDAVTGAHVRRVAQYALALAEAAGLDEHEMNAVERIALFHDIGKIDEALFDIFHDTDNLTPEEKTAVMTHPARGTEVLEPLRRFYPELRAGVLSHHERWDGTGYPRGLKGCRIPFAARIVSIADAFDAITHSRRYNAKRSFEEATRAILEGRGTQFDPDLVDLFLTPPVAESIESAMRAANEPGRRRSKHRSKAVKGTPDLTFRWRPARRGRRSRNSGHLQAR